MYAVIKQGESMAMIWNGEWYSDDEVLLRVLRSMQDPDGPSGGDPQPDVTEAHHVAKILGAEVVDEEIDKHELGLIY